MGAAALKCRPPGITSTTGTTMLARFLIVLIVFCAAPLSAVALAEGDAIAGQVPNRAQDAEELSLQAFKQAVETAISTMDRNRWIELLSPTADREQSLEFFDAMVPQGITRVVVKERDRSALQGALPGEGYQFVLEVFQEAGNRGRIATWRLDIRRPRGKNRRAALADFERRTAGVDRRPAPPGVARREAVRRAQPRDLGRSTSRCDCRPAMSSSPKPPKASPRSC